MPGGVANRPHIKTHKSPVLAKMQVAAGARGITCQKLGEAEVMVDGGLDDILISYNILGEEKVGPPGPAPASGRRSPWPPTTRPPSPACRRPAEIAGRPLGVVIECDTGRKRAGVETAREAIELARLIKDKPRPALRRLPVLSDRDLLAADAALLRGGDERASGRSGSRRASSRPAARRTSSTSGSSRAPPSTAPAPTSSTTA